MTARLRGNQLPPVEPHALSGTANKNGSMSYQCYYDTSEATYGWEMPWRVVRNLMRRYIAQPLF
jgi:hypothetical protein